MYRDQPFFRFLFLNYLLIFLIFGPNSEFLIYWFSCGSPDLVLSSLFFSFFSSGPKVQSTTTQMRVETSKFWDFGIFSLRNRRFWYNFQSTRYWLLIWILWFFPCFLLLNPFSSEIVRLSTTAPKTDHTITLRSTLPLYDLLAISVIYLPLVIYFLSLVPGKPSCTYVLDMTENMWALKIHLKQINCDWKVNDSDHDYCLDSYFKISRVRPAYILSICIFLSALD